jgi:excisionase family DNA binding protein
MNWGVIFIENTTISLENKILLNIKEAADLFGIGQRRLREIVKEDYENKYHLMLGRTIKIKRKQFEEFIEQVEQI